jgi:CheY-like chemotaxis protein
MTGPEVSTHRPHALIVDLDELVLLALEHALEDIGVDTTTMWEPEVACHELARGEYDVFLVGHHPPAIDAQRALDCRGATPCIILIPQDADPDAQRAWQQRGAIDVACKHDLVDVRQAVQRALRAGKKPAAAPQILAKAANG